MKLERIDHTAIVVRDLDEALPRYEQTLGLACRERATVSDQRIEVAFLPIGDTQLELIQPTDEQSGVARFLAMRGETLHHIAIAVDDIRTELAELASRGVELIDREPRQGPHGLIAFIHPRGIGGILVELVENRL